jgi:diguanylate cyclase (GGDEF)-like protein
MTGRPHRSAPVFRLVLVLLVLCLACPVAATSLAQRVAGASQLRLDNPEQCREACLGILRDLGASVDSPEGVAVFRLLAETSYILEDGESTIRYAARGLALQSRTREQDVRLRLSLSGGFDLLGQYERALAELDAAGRVADAAGDPALRALVRARRGQEASMLKRYREALVDVVAAAALLERVSDLETRSDVLNAIAETYVSMEDYPKALDYHLKTLAVLERLGNRQQIAAGCYNVARLQHALGSTQPALAFYRRSLGLCRQLEDASGVAFALQGIASLTGEKGDRRAAIRDLGEAVRLFDRLRHVQMQVSSRIDMAELHLAGKDLAQALAIATAALDLADKAGLQDRLIDIRALLARLCEASGDFRSAFAHQREFIRLSAAAWQKERESAQGVAREQLGTRLKEQENATLARENEIRRLQLESHRALQNVYFGAAVVSVLVLLFLCWLLVRKGRVEKRLRWLAQTDELTGLLNRRAVLARGRAEYDRSLRYGFDLSVLLMDLDRLKEVNDRHGHDAGDRVLAEFGDLCRDTLRISDICGRWGGDEFVAILPHTDAGEALAVAGRICERARQVIVPRGPGGTATTLSIGIALRDAGDTGIEDTLKRADEAAYAAKTAGRDCVRVHGVGTDTAPGPAGETTPTPEGLPG